MISTKSDWVDSWHANPSSNRDYELIDGIRGIAILLVVFGHTIYSNPKDTNPLVLWIAAIGSMGYTGVSIFFTLSGFLISWPFWRRKVRGSSKVIPPGYGWRRFYKIYPPLALSILLLTPLTIANRHDWSIILTALQWLSGLSLIIPPRSDLNSVMWSLIVETQFYILLPLLFLCFRRTQIKLSLLLIFLCLFLGGIISNWIYALFGLYNAMNPYLVFYFPTFVDAFAFGVLLAGLESYWGGLPKSWARLGDVGAILLVTTLMAGAILSFYHIERTLTENFSITFAVRISTTLLLCYIANPQYPPARLLSYSWLRWCGIISYEWYLFHQPLTYWLRMSVGPAEGSWIRYIGTLGVGTLAGLALAAITYRYFSLPILKSGRTKHSASAAAAPA